MSMFSKTVFSGLVAFGLSTGAAFAQAPAAPATAPAAKAPAAPAAKAPAAAPAKTVGVPKKASTPEGEKCSAEADAKNLHGKDRVKFRKKCISDIKKAAKAAAKAAKAPATAPAAPAAPAKKN